MTDAASATSIPTDTGELTRELELRRLRVSEPWTSLFFTMQRDGRQDVADFRQPLDFIKAMKGTDMVVAELGHSVHQQPLAILPNRPIFTDAQWDGLTHGLNDSAR